MMGDGVVPSLSPVFLCSFHLSPDNVDCGRNPLERPRSMLIDRLGKGKRYSKILSVSVGFVAIIRGPTSLKCHGGQFSVRRI